MSAQSTNCIFCKILRREEPGEIIFENDVVACIKDIRPASTHHYLILPKHHVKDAKSLSGPEHEKIFDEMVNGIATIRDKLALNLEQTRTGFHWPPFTTVKHLHLHVISPVNQMGLIGKLIFLPNSLWFTSVDYVKSRFQIDS